MQVLGVCRFSVLCDGGFQVEHQSLDERAAYLYAPDRMEDRFRHFEAVTLPSIRAQTDPDFHFLVILGHAMPAQYHDRLHDLTRDVPQAHVRAYAPAVHRPMMQAAINAFREEIPGPCIQFRHDDDDAVATCFVARLREVARDCGKIFRQHRALGIDFNRGFVAEPGPDGLLAAPIVQPYWGVAQAMVVPPRSKQTIMNFAHFKLNRHMPTITFTDEDMFVRGHNNFNDSRQIRKGPEVDLAPLDDDQKIYFRERFNIDDAAVRRIFS